MAPYDQRQYASNPSLSENNSSAHYQNPQNGADNWAPRPSRSGRRTRGERAAAPVTGAAAAHSMVTPGADNYSDSASGGMAGIAYSVAERNARESGIQASRPPAPGMPQQVYSQPPTGGDPFTTESNSYSSLNSSNTTTRSGRSGRSSPNGTSSAGMAGIPVAYAAYRDDPYGGLSRTSQPELGVVDPNAIEDDGDDFGAPQRPQRQSWLSQNNGRNAAAGAAAGGVAAAGASRAAGDGGAAYGAVGTSYTGAGSGPGEKGAWAAAQTSKKTKTIRWIIIVVVVLAIIGAIIGALAGTGVFGSGGSGSSGGSGQSADEDTRENGDLDKNSAQIKALLNNKKLHKVFPGMDYTPINSQYPDCLKNPPSQNNVTRDMAVLSQLTNQVRLYGTDCNQTAMAVHAIRQLGMEDTLKIWLGVWQDGNETTNARQLEQMWDTLDTYGETPFAGLIVANEILFREEMTDSELGSLIGDVRQNLTDRGLSLEVSTSDLGDDWNSSINSTSSSIMANIHPFFAGVPADKAAAWTYNFWSKSDGQWWRSDSDKNIIAETGWPTQGGTSCGSDTITECDNGSVASIDGLNQFMDDWVCQAISNGTRYFWFSAFDEPWKIVYNTKGRDWEDQWGIMDVDRNLKDGVTIPDCGGSTVEDAGW